MLLVILTGPAIEALQGLRPEGRWVLMGMSNEKLTLDPFSLSVLCQRIIGSKQNNLDYLYEALDYVARGKVKVMTESFPLKLFSEKTSLPQKQFDHLNRIQLLPHSRPDQKYMTL